MKTSLIIILFQGFFLVLAFGQGLGDDNRLILEPSRKEYVYGLKVGQKYRIACIYNHSDADLDTLVWRDLKTSKVIDGDSSPDVFTVSIYQRGTHNRILSLVFTHFASSDAGNYVCEATNFARVTYTRTIRIEALGSFEWNSDNTVVGGLVDNKIVVDCGASGDPKPRIIITDEKGGNLSALKGDHLGADFIVDGDRIYIPKLSTEYQGRKIKCMATQEFPNYDHDDAEQKTVTLEVFFPPQFLSDEVTRYGIVGRNVTIECKVERSNPAVKNFSFYKDSEMLTSDLKKYTVVADMEKQIALLTVNDITETDFGKYVCEADNAQAKSSRTIQLNRADPPEEVKVSYEHAKQNSIVFRIHQSQEEQLPVNGYSIRYIRKSILEHDDWSWMEEDLLWHNFGERLTKPIAEDGLYEIGKLQNNTEYVFRISAENEAGVGKEFRFTAGTAARNIINDVPKATSHCLASFFLIAVVVFLQ